MKYVWSLTNTVSSFQQFATIYGGKNIEKIFESLLSYMVM